MDHQKLEQLLKMREKLIELTGENNDTEIKVLPLRKYIGSSIIEQRNNQWLNMLYSETC